MHTTATVAPRLRPQPSPLPPPQVSSSPYPQRTQPQAYPHQRHPYNNATISAVYSSNKLNLTIRDSTSPPTVTSALAATKERKADSEKMGRSRGRSQQVSRAALARKASEERRVKGEIEANRGRGAEMQTSSFSTTTITTDSTHDLDEFEYYSFQCIQLKLKLTLHRKPQCTLTADTESHSSRV
ncbi:hypothetical protein CCMSSC00406_0002657 [Pleurotus cornucopiae]|uniref:Uncharacterized protein n=1 Tax=Pleurotus cornucopiae TaxID=5321 RepID=A0ACB7IVP5_PLECO|nr:hypothetical protein CCMSSC00406_0002657 [Pleurotus cornucopiae]